MPELDEVYYSRDATVAAFQNYYRFLATMYLDEDLIEYPPEGGWPNITPDRWEGFDKTDEVFALLRQLPYIKKYPIDMDDVFTAPGGPFSNYAAFPPTCNGEDIKRDTEYIAPDFDNTVIPPRIVGLVSWAKDSPVILLDTELGVIYWFECPSGVRSQEGILSGLDTWAEEELIPEDQVEWRESCRIWAIEDFFEEVKTQFRKLNFVPVGDDNVDHFWIGRGDPEYTAMMHDIQKVYRDCGWPDSKSFSKRECHTAVLGMLQEKYPSEAYRYLPENVSRRVS
ncbi:hypothetical protein M011DRAFT_471834 [Sporormia fimetaria CBS 119925]|uniref:Uncharacterized protein n=1 Tax=Sporormia fimetaria CBS 119925 TaxID=1340428 RepID=A0A6A6UXE1_9PLEO|nr:hypothetical protein M011DRAFT_471834 [Sporormia fimetaria CBS 119925]